MSPKVAIIGSTIRPNLWMKLYESVGTNTLLDFEVVFVGPTEPEFLLPSNFRFIKSMVKPAQCVEIASRSTNADFLLNFTDDMIFCMDSPLDELYKIFQSCNNPKTIVSCLYHGSPPQHHLFPNSPLVPVAGFINSNFFRELGGIDRNFIALYWDLDIALRALSVGGNTVLSKVGIKELPVTTPRLWHEYGGIDRKFLDSIWIWSNGSPVRSQMVDSFSDDKILEVSQGAKGRW